jgi:hypothetical protein
VGDGRTDARRSHGALSATLWGLTAVFTAILGSLAWWAASARATDLVQIYGGVETAPRGPWVAAGGPLRAGRGAGRFLFDTASGRSVRIRSEGPVFSANGSRAAWAQERIGFFERGRKADLFVAQLSSAKYVGTGLACSIWCRLALSPSGNRIAVFDESTLAAYDISDPSNPKQLAAIPTRLGVRTFVFVDDDTVRIFPRYLNSAHRRDIAPQDFQIEEFCLSSKKSFITGRFTSESLPNLHLSADGRYFVGSDRKRLILHDGRTGALLATLSEDLERPSLRFLSGGRMAVAGVAGGNGVLKIFLEGERTPSQRVELGAANFAFPGGEVAPRRVAVAINTIRRNDETEREESKVAVVDLTEGKVDSHLSGLVPADRFSWWFSPVLPPAEAGLPASKLFLDASGALVRLDPATMKQEILLGGRR